MSVAEKLAQIEAATERMLATVATLDASALAQPSRLPDWSRGHVAAHMARNSDGISNLLLAARTGEPIGMYASQEARNADIAAGAGRPPEVHQADLAAGAQRLRVIMRTFPEDAWDNTLRFAPNNPESPLVPARFLLGARLFEVEAHHGDLDAGYSFADTPAELLPGFLDHVARLCDCDAAFTAATTDLNWSATIGEGDAVPTVNGPAHALLSWLSGRSRGEGLTCDDGELPAQPSL